MSFPDGPLRQPDGRSCGAAVVVAHRMLTDPEYAEAVGGRFADEVLATHRRLTGTRRPGGGLQLPWPRGLGTPPWAVASALTRQTGRQHRCHAILPWSRSGALGDVRRALEAGPVALYVGNRWLPRHVVLVIDTDLHTYDPATGGVVTLDPGAFTRARLHLGAWTHPWFWIG